MSRQERLSASDSSRYERRRQWRDTESRILSAGPPSFLVRPIPGRHTPKALNFQPESVTPNPISTTQTPAESGVVAGIKLVGSESRELMRWASRFQKRKVLNLCKEETSDRGDTSDSVGSTKRAGGTVIRRGSRGRAARSVE